jgi:hypothetical protein
VRGFSSAGVGFEPGEQHTRQASDHFPRLFLETRRMHRYAADDLANPGQFWLIPWCQEDVPYPDRHPQEELIEDTSRALDACGPCAARHLARQKAARC